MNNNSIMLLILLGTIVSCTFGRPDLIGSTNFKSIDDISILEGKYSNTGIGGENIHILSKLIWPMESSSWHDSVEAIQVTKVSESVLNVKALIEEGTVKKEEIFSTPEDFVINNGRLQLRKENHLEFGFGQIVGVAYKATEIGIGSDGNGKVRGHQAALAWFIFPIAILGYEDVRFEKFE